MGRHRSSIRIDAAPEVVFDVVSDVENAPERIDWFERVDMLTEGPTGVGTRWRETRRIKKKQAVEEWEMTAFERPKYFTAYCDSSGYDIEWTMRIAPDGDGTRLTWDMSTKPRTFIGKVLTPAEIVMSAMMKSVVRRDLEATKAYVEQTASG